MNKWEEIKKKILGNDVERWESYAQLKRLLIEEREKSIKKELDNSKPS